MSQVWLHAFSVKSNQGGQRRPAKGITVYVKFHIPPSLVIMQVEKKTPKVTCSLISPCSHNISLSPPSLLFQAISPFFPILYLPPQYVTTHW